VRTFLAAAGVALALLAGCGAPDELSRDDAAKLAAARERLDDAIDTEETLRTSRGETRRIRAEIRKIVSGGALEAEKLDEFGLAALGELQQVVPSVVETDADGVPTDLDRRALRTFLSYANSDPKRALVGPARDAVETIEDTVKSSDADGDTRVPQKDRTASGDETVDEYLRAAQRDLEPIWPHLAKRLGDIL